MASAEGLEIKRDDDQTKTTWELEPVIFNFTLYYDGAQSTAIVDVRLFDEPQGWSHDIKGTSSGGRVGSEDFIRVMMYRQETARVTTKIIPGEGCRGGRYIITMFVSVEGELTLHDTCNIHVGVPDIYGHSSRLIDHPPEGWNGMSGSTVMFRTEIENTGNMDDSFEVEASIKRGRGGWSVDIVQGIVSDGYTPILLPGSTYVVTYRVTIPSSTVQSTEGLVLVVVRPLKGHMDLTTEIEARVVVDNSPALRVEVDGGRVWEIDPMEAHGFCTTLRVTNAQRIFTSVRSSIGLSTPANGMITSLSPSYCDLDPGEEGLFNLTVDTVLDGKAGTYIVL
ncbi:MAG: hypothetical protein LN414_07940, partial [Candidatus Thermoplasmatota archaeon]|nr:hypothetical protein [Candidatus Thermoplasmatota archaeon]